MKRVLIAAGGTGGHFYPGLAAARVLRARGWEALFAVRREDPARAALDAAGIPFVEVDLKGLPRRPGADLLAFPWRLARACALLGRVTRDYGPAALLGTGGYLTFPAVWAARRRGIPAALHESNAVLGLANRASVALGARLFWGLPPAPGQPAGPVTGTPVREELLVPRDTAEARRRFGLEVEGPAVLCFGGSQGAASLNAAMPAAAAALPPGTRVLHLAGRGKDAAVREAYARAGTKAAVLEFCDDMAAAYAAADLVVCRAGASTLAELMALRKKAVLVPYPHAAGDHQRLNAETLARAGAARWLPDDAALPAALRTALAAPAPEPDFERLGAPAAARAAEALAGSLEELAR